MTLAEIGIVDSQYAHIVTGCVGRAVDRVVDIQRSTLSGFEVFELGILNRYFAVLCAHRSAVGRTGYVAAVENDAVDRQRRIVVR